MAVLTISREYQNGGDEIGTAVARELGYDFVDKNRLHADLEVTGEKWGQMVEELDGVRPRLWEKYDREYRTYIALIESSIYEYALKDRVVILGRGSVFLLHDIPQVLKVRLFAPLEVRIDRVIRKDGVDRQTAEWMVKKIDKERAGYIQANYRKHWEDQENYDLLINTGMQTYEQVTQELVEVLKEWDKHATPEGWQRLRNRALAAKVKAQILTQLEVFIPTLEIFHDGQAIVLKGMVHSPKAYRLVVEMAHKMADPHPIRNEFHYRK